MTAILKADDTAATRVLTAAVKRAAELIHDGADPEALLTAAGVAAGVLIDGGGE
jgi:hypothetical protein